MVAGNIYLEMFTFDVTLPMPGKIAGSDCYLIWITSFLAYNLLFKFYENLTRTS